MKAELQRMVKSWRYAKMHTFASRLLVGADGSVWMEEPWILENDPRQYLVYDSTGTALARVVLPPRINVLRVCTRELLGVWKNEDDVPHLMRWRIGAANGEASPPSRSGRRTQRSPRTRA